MPPPDNWEPMTQEWHGERALLFVHGVGDAEQGYYDDLTRTVRDALGAQAGEVAMYEMYYDVFNDWAAAKTDLKGIVGSFKSAIRPSVKDEADGDDDFTDTFAEYGGDVLLPAFSRSTRLALRDACIAQLQRMVGDGNTAGVPARDQKLSIVCHSLGCFHTFEALHEIATNEEHELHPLQNRVTFQNVFFMASPVQLIRTTFGAIDPAIPASNELATLRGPALEQPPDAREPGTSTVKRWVSITGDLDPVGGYFLKKRVGWAYMNVPPQEPPRVDVQHLVDLPDDGDFRKALRDVLEDAIVKKGGPNITLNNPHSWDVYMENHKKEIAEWLFEDV